jgi:hypothetical protein
MGRPAGPGLSPRCCQGEVGESANMRGSWWPGLPMPAIAPNARYRVPVARIAQMAMPPSRGLLDLAT